MAAVSWKVMSKFVKIPPEAWDWIVPHGPVTAHVVNRRGDAVSLNPQPLPPLEAVVGAQLLENVLVSAIIIVGGKGAGEGAGVLRAEIDDWCGTGWPRQVAPAQAPEGLGREPGLRRRRARRRRPSPTQYDHSPEMQEALGAAAEQLAEAAGRALTPPGTVVTPGVRR